MINIYNKTKKEIEFEEAQHRYGARLVRGTPTPVCPTFIITHQGKRINTWDLTETQILGLIELDVKDFTSSDGSYKKTGKTKLDTFKLIEAVKSTWTPSYEALIQIAEMEEQFGHIMADIFGTIDTNNVKGDARTIATYKKETNGDFSPVTNEEIIAVIKQLSCNKKKRKEFRR